jgi:hypothetical protein
LPVALLASVRAMRAGSDRPGSDFRFRAIDRGRSVTFPAFSFASIPIVRAIMCSVSMVPVIWHGSHPQVDPYLNGVQN